MYLLTRLREPVSSALLAEPGELALALGRDGSIEWATDTVDLTDPAPAGQAVDQDQRDHREGNGVDDLCRPLAVRGQIPLGQGRGDAHEKTDGHGDGQASHSLGGDDRSERGCNEEREPPR